MANKATANLEAKLIEAVDLALEGDWEGAHLIAQDHEGNEHADWIGRCRRIFRESVSTAAELREIRAALSGQER